ncbi:MAG: hypothetical protein ABI903_16115 [Actinomycetota bacterium]
MNEIRNPLVALAMILAAAALSAGCGAPPQKVAVAVSGTVVASAPGSTSPAPSSSTPASPGSQAPPAAVGESGRRGGHAARPPAAGGLPADWPPDLSVPQGNIISSTGGAGRWSVLILAAGSAAQVRQSTLAFYSSAGFTAVSDSILNKGNRQITLVVENRDHSNTQTNLVIAVTTQ